MLVLGLEFGEWKFRKNTSSFFGFLVTTLFPLYLFSTTGTWPIQPYVAGAEITKNPYFTVFGTTYFLALFGIMLAFRVRISSLSLRCWTCWRKELAAAVPLPFSQVCGGFGDTSTSCALIIKLVQFTAATPLLTVQQTLSTVVCKVHKLSRSSEACPLE